MEKHSLGRGLAGEVFEACMDDLGVESRHHGRLLKLFDHGNAVVDPAEFCESLDAVVLSNRSAVYRSCFNLFDTARTECVTQADIDAAQQTIAAGKSSDALTTPTAAMIQVITKLVSSQTNQSLTYEDFHDAVSTESALLKPFVVHIICLVSVNEGDDIDTMRIRVQNTKQDARHGGKKH